jgi:5-methylcytosine-specific restriction protein A
MKHIENNNLEIVNALKAVLELKTDLELANKIGVSASHISNIKKAKKNFSRKKMIEIEKVLSEKSIVISSMLPLSNESSTASESEHFENIRGARDAANGICDLCNQPAPFNDKLNNPYLLVKQITPSVHGGGFEASNLVALCPNCAAKLEVRGDTNDFLYLKEKKRNVV